eukprot:1955298-Prymnesium_polylepis.1
MSPEAVSGRYARSSQGRGKNQHVTARPTSTDRPPPSRRRRINFLRFHTISAVKTQKFRGFHSGG